MSDRLQKILAHAGIDSRRKCEELIKEGRVTVNGKIATIGESADAQNDSIKIDGKRVKFEKMRYIALYKPAGYICTVSDNFGSKLVVDLVKVKERVFPVGRLDADAEGLILMTNDGDFANKMMHPRYEVEKTYVAKLKTPLSPSGLARLARGIVIDRRKVKAEVKVLDKEKIVVQVTIHEGRHKIVKRMFKEAGSYVHKLKRTKIGNLSLGDLRVGEWREIKRSDVDALVKK